MEEVFFVFKGFFICVLIFLRLFKVRSWFLERWDGYFGCYLFGRVGEFFRKYRMFWCVSGRCIVIEKKNEIFCFFSKLGKNLSIVWVFFLM